MPAISGFEAEFLAYVDSVSSLTSGTDLFSTAFPARIDAATVLRFFAGRQPAGDSALFAPSVQFLTRAKTEAAARTTNGALYDVLHSGASGTHRIALTSWLCTAIQAIGMPARVGDDASKRAQWSFTLRMFVQPL